MISYERNTWYKNEEQEYIKYGKFGFCQESGLKFGVLILIADFDCMLC